MSSAAKAALGSAAVYLLGGMVTELVWRARMRELSGHPVAWSLLGAAERVLLWPGTAYNLRAIGAQLRRKRARSEET